jgi:NADH-quinone oxidoreductase subunit N
VNVLAQVAPFNGPAVDWFALTPLIVLTGGAVVLMLGGALLPVRWRVPKGTYVGVTAAVSVAALVLTFVLWHRVQEDGPKQLLGGAIVLDGPALFITVVILASIVLTALFLDDYLRREGLEGCEVYALVLVSAIGGIVMAWSADLIVLFLGLETLSLALYVLCASHLKRIESQESGMKYFILGGFSSAFFLYGIALEYGATGSTRLRDIFAFLGNTALSDKGLLFAGLALLLVGFGFKIAAAPFHMWTPDVYEGAPSPVTGFVASASKAGAFAALLRVMTIAFFQYRVDWRPIVYALAVLSLFVGAVLAIVQTNVKRMLAYSSIAHVGFILVGVEAMANEPTTGQIVSLRGYSSALFYLLAYAVMVLGSFGVVALVGRTGDADHSLDSYRGLARTRPLLAFTFTVLLLAQAGVPLTSGFIAKFDIILAAVDAKSYVLAVLAMVSAVIAAYLYLRIIVSMYLSDAPESGAPPVQVPPAAGIGLGLALAFTVVVGFLPGLVVDFARDAAATVTL